MTALRLARARTGRTKVVIFAGSYHGHSDGDAARAREVGGTPQSAPLAPGIPPRVVEDVLVLDYGSPRALELLREHAGRDRRRARRAGAEPPPGVAAARVPARVAERGRARRAACSIFDEMITGFRIHPGGAQAWFGVEADLATYGKIVGGGLPDRRRRRARGLHGRHRRRHVAIRRRLATRAPRPPTSAAPSASTRLAMAARAAVLQPPQARGPGAASSELNERTSRPGRDAQRTLRRARRCRSASRTSARSSASTITGNMRSALLPPARARASTCGSGAAASSRRRTRTRTIEHVVERRHRERRRDARGRLHPGEARAGPRTAARRAKPRAPHMTNWGTAAPVPPTRP